MGYLPSSKR